MPSNRNLRSYFVPGVGDIETRRNRRFLVVSIDRDVVGGFGSLIRARACAKEHGQRFTVFDTVGQRIL
jgi:hypothetical protein